MTLARLEWATALFDSPAYRQSLERRILSGRALPMESLLWQYLQGKPKEHLEHSLAPHSGPLLEIVVPPHLVPGHGDRDA